jgi:hypothetical protein
MRCRFSPARATGFFEISRTAALISQSSNRHISKYGLLAAFACRRKWAYSLIFRTVIGRLS